MSKRKLKRRLAELERELANLKRLRRMSSRTPEFYCVK